MTYTSTVAEIRALRAQWRRSDDDYRAHPFAVCVGWLTDHDGGNERPCLNVRHPRDVMCRSCRAAAAKRRAA